MVLKDKRILLGVSGGIAVYKALLLARQLTTLGAKVRVVMTKSAEEFVTPLSFQALTLEEVRTSLFDLNAERAMSHIELARWAELIIIAPASANMIAQMAHGLAPDLLSTIYLVANVPILVCPAMNHSMWDHPATKANCALLKERGVFFIGPDEGSQACGEEGFGRMSEVDSIIDALHLFDLKDLFKNKEILITAGATREYIDPVRFISNCSSGKMAYALAKAFVYAGAKVTLVSGHSNCKIPENVSYIFAESAIDMHKITLENLKPKMIVIAAAAVGDYRVATISKEKMKKNNANLDLELIQNPDIVQELALTKLPSYIVGFAAETKDLLVYAKEKLVKKSLDMVIANLVGKHKGFNVDENAVTILTKNKVLDCSQKPKLLLAKEIVQYIAQQLK